MIRGEPLTAIIPVRGGSKGIPRKNLYKVGKDSLLERTIKLAKASRYVDRILVSTEDSEMYAIAKAHGVAAPHPRPAHLATDSASTIDVVRDLVESAAIERGYLVLLQVTSPLRTIADLDALCRAFDEGDPNAEGIASVVRFDAPHPDKIQKIHDGYVVSYLGKESMVARHLLPEVYALNGAFYLTHRDVLVNQRTFMPRRVLPFVMPADRSLNLDNPRDLLLLEAMIEKGYVTVEEYDI